MLPTPLTPSDAMLRLAGAGALTSLAVAHLWTLPHKFAESTYMAMLFGLLVVAAMVLALTLVQGGRALGFWGWAAAAALALSAMAGYILSRTVPLPQLEGHVGHWQDPLGTASLVIEASILLLAPLGIHQSPPRRNQGRSRRGGAVIFSVCAVGVVAVLAVLASVPSLTAVDGAPTPGHEHHELEVPGLFLLAGLLGGGGFILTGGVLVMRRMAPASKPRLGDPVQRGLQPALTACAACVSLAPALAGILEGNDHHHSSGHHSSGHHSSGHHGSGPLYPDLAGATAAQRSAARRLLLRSRAATKRFSTLDGAEAAGFERHRFPEERGQFFHMEKCPNWVDRRTLDPRRPESLVYWRRPEAPDPQLVAVMYRAPADRPAPTAGSPVIQWHGHPSRGGAPPGRVTGPTLMTHLWLTPHLRTAYARRPPRRALARALDERRREVSPAAPTVVAGSTTSGGPPLRYLWGGCWKRPPA